MSWAVVGSIASIAVARGAQVWSRAQLTRQQMQDAMVDSLYQKAADSQEGVLHSVLDELCDQHTREMIIAYSILLMKGAMPFMDTQALDRCAMTLQPAGLPVATSGCAKYAACTTEAALVMSMS